MPQNNKDKKKPASAKPAPAALQSSYVPSGRASLIRIEEIHRQLKGVTPQGVRTVTIKSLAKDLEVAPNTVKVDLELLRIFNAPIDYDTSRRTMYYTGPAYELRPPLWLQERQVLALLVAIRVAGYSRTFPLGRDLVSAMQAIAPLIAGGSALGPETLDPVFSTADSVSGEREAGHFAVLCEAIAQRLEVKIMYRKPNDDVAAEERVVHPLHWFMRPDACLLIVHDPRIGGRRNFELVRMQSVEPTGERFAAPDGFDLKKYLAGSFGRFVGEATCEVRVRIAREYVPLLRERPWQEHQVLVELPEGGAEAVYRVCHTADLEQNVLRAGGQVQVISPPEVRERVRAAAERILKAHA